jgi:DNA helicase HerA-like ATPase
VLSCKAKVILFDATGEFYTLSSPVCHVHIGIGTPFPEKSEELVLPYHELTEGDLLALFKPSGLSQGPKLRLAMKSLKLAKLVPELAAKGFVEKVQKSKLDFEKHYALNAEKIESPRADFDITQLVRQINEECVYPSAGFPPNSDFTKWGKADEKEQGYCVTLLVRIEEMLSSKDLSCIFQPSGKRSVIDILESFFKSADQQVLRISLKYVPFGHNTREIVANALGRYLLSTARDGRFRDQPLVLFLDEAHQFLNKQLGDDNTRYPLDSFELIAKEGRKFCLNICIATQRPRDIPEGVLSQIGTLIVHRLTNDRDREVVERASGEIDRSAAAFLPTLAPGQAVVIGVDFPMPLTIQVTEPNQKPDSKGPNYQTHWRHHQAAPEKQKEAKKPKKK